jgi:hypothetical protein
MNAQKFHIERVIPRRCYEAVATRPAPSLNLPLHFAPGHWLLPDPAQEVLARVGGQPGIVIVDVDGKWQRRILSGPRVWRVLAVTADVATMLRGRDCAALTLFDCPGIAARSGDGVEVWIVSSYAQFLDEQLVAAATRI